MANRLTQAGKAFYVRRSSQRDRYAVFACECGERTVARVTLVHTGKIKSCGCLKRERHREAVTTHGHSTKAVGRSSRTYQSWRSMIARCTNPNTVNFKNYGFRGIRVCASWMNFEAFLKDMGERPPNCTLDRIDVNGNYTKDNCRWSDEKTQKNNRRDNVIIVVNGEEMTIAMASDRFGVKPYNISRRIKSGWSEQSAATTPERPKRAPQIQKVRTL